MNMEDKDEDWVRPRGRNAPIWEHFKENKKDREEKKEIIRVKCNHCPSIFNHSSSTTNYIRHMNSHHPGLLKTEEKTESQTSKQPLIASVFPRVENEPLKKASTSVTMTPLVESAYIENHRIKSQ